MPPKLKMGEGLAKSVPPKAPHNAGTSNAVTSSVTRPDPFAAPAVAPQVSEKTVEVRPGFKLARAREVKPHVSVYLHPRVIAKVKEIAAAEARKPHDVYLDALALLL